MASSTAASASENIVVVSVVEVEPPPTQQTLSDAIAEFANDTAIAATRSVGGPIGESDEKAAAAKPTKMGPRQWALTFEVIVLTLGVMYIELCLVPALPEIQKQFSEHSDWIPWILSAYNIIGAVWTAISGCLADMVGPKWLLVLNMCIYMIGQIVAALGSKSIFVLIVGRALQGFGMSVFVLCLTIIRTEMPERFVMPIMGLVSSMMSVGMSIGIIGGAASLEKLKWNEMFWVTLPIIAIFVVAFAITMPGKFPGGDRILKKFDVVSRKISGKKLNIPDVQSANKQTVAASPIQTPGPSADCETPRVAPDSKKKTPFQIDILGALMLAVGVIMLLMSLTFSETWGWNDAGTLSLLIISIAILIALIAWEFYVKKPLIPVRLLLRRDQLIIVISSILSGLAQFAVFQMLPYLYTDPLMNFKATRMMTVGLYLLPFGIATLIAMPIAVLMGRYTGHGLAVVLAGCIGTLGTGLMIKFQTNTANAIILNGLCGGGLGMLSIETMNLIADITAPELFGTVSGTSLLLRFVGGSLGPIFVNLVMKKNVTQMGPYEFFQPKAFENGFIFMTGVFAGSTLVTFFLPNIWMAFTRKGRAELKKKGFSTGAGH